MYLTVALRQELNGLVVKLNQVTSKAVDDVNRELGSKAVHFVDVMPYFDNHRWCEKSADPQFHEPDENRADTWYFLSGWKDVDATSLLGALAGPDSSLVVCCAVPKTWLYRTDFRSLERNKRRVRSALPGRERQDRATTCKNLRSQSRD